MEAPSNPLDQVAYQNQSNSNAENPCYKAKQEESPDRKTDSDQETDYIKIFPYTFKEIIYQEDHYPRFQTISSHLQPSSDRPVAIYR